MSLQNPKWRFSKNIDARVPFAIVAVMLMIMVGITGAYMSTVNIESEERMRQHKEIEKMDSSITASHLTLTGVIYEAVGKAIAESSVFSWDLSEINTATTDAILKYIQKNYSPNRTSEFDIYINQTKTNVYVLPEMMKTKDCIPTCLTADDNADLTVAGTFVNSTDQFSYFRVVGTVYYLGIHRASGNKLEKMLDFERVVWNPLPLLKSKMDALKTAAQGNGCEISLLTQFMLNAIAQYRVLLGRGQGKVSGVGSAAETQMTNARETILTQEEISLAANLAIMLVIARQFRTVDSSVPAAIDENAPGKNVRTLDPSRSMLKMMDQYVRNNTVDPSDIIALYLGLDKEYDISLILGQIINSLIENFLLKVLDYFGIYPIVNFFYEAAQFITDIIKGAKDKVTTAINDFLSGLLPRYFDANQDTAKFANYAKEFLRGAMKNASKIESPYKTYLPNFNEELLNPPSGGWPTTHFAPGAFNDFFYTVYVSRTWTVRHYDWKGRYQYTTYHLEYQIEKATVTTTITPFDEKIEFKAQTFTDNANDKIWADFYTNSLKDEAKENTGEVKSVRDSLKSVALRIAEVLKNHATKILADSKYTLKLDPKDNTDFLETVLVKTRETISAIAKFYQSPEGKNELENSIKAFLKDGAASKPLTEPYNELTDLLSNKYAELVHLTPVADYSKENPNDQRVIKAYDLAKRHTDALNEVTFSVGPRKAIGSGQLSSRSGYPYSSVPSDDFGGGYSYHSDQQLQNAALGQMLSRPVSPANNAFSYWSSSDHLEKVVKVMGTFVDAAFEKEKQTEVGTAGDTAPTSVVKPILLTISTSVEEGWFSKLKDLFIDGAIGAFASFAQSSGLILRLENLSNAIIEDTLSTENVTNARLIEPVRLGQPFEFWGATDDYQTAKQNGSLKTEKMTVIQEPRYLTPGKDLNIRYLQGSAEQLHFTELGKAVTNHPYESRWTYCIKGSFSLSARTDTRTPRSTGGSDFIWLNQTINLDFKIPITVYSGWELGVAVTQDTATFAADFAEFTSKIVDATQKAVSSVLTAVWQFINEYIMPFLRPILDPILDLVKKLMDLIADISSRVIQLATQLIELIQNAIASACKLISDIIEREVEEKEEDFWTFADNIFADNIISKAAFDQIPHQLTLEILSFSVTLDISDIKDHVTLIIEKGDGARAAATITLQRNYTTPTEMLTIDLEIDWVPVLVMDVSIHPLHSFIKQSGENEGDDGAGSFLAGTATVMNRVNLDIIAPGEKSITDILSGEVAVSISLESLLHLIPAIGSVAAELVATIDPDLNLIFSVQIEEDTKELREKIDALFSPIKSETSNPLELLRTYLQRAWDLLEFIRNIQSTIQDIKDKFAISFHFTVGLSVEAADNEASLSADFYFKICTLDIAFQLLKQFITDPIFILSIIVSSFLVAVGNVAGPVGMILGGTAAMVIAGYAVKHVLSKLPNPKEIAENVFIGISVSGDMSSETPVGIFKKTKTDYSALNLEIQLTGILEAMGVRTKEEYIDAAKDPNIDCNKIIEAADKGETGTDWGIWTADISSTIGCSEGYAAVFDVNFKVGSVRAGLYLLTDRAQDVFSIHVEEIEDPVVPGAPSGVAGDDDNDGLNDAHERELANTYAPILKFDKNERCFPTDMRYQLDHSDLRDGSGNEIAIHPVSVSKLAGASASVVLDNYLGTSHNANPNGIIVEYEKDKGTYGTVVYSHVTKSRYQGVNYIVIQYYFYYAYNYGKVNDHEGDWENIEIILDEKETPMYVVYSQHWWKDKKEWNDKDVEKQQTHVVDYVALGSHANYFDTSYTIEDTVTGNGAQITVNPQNIVALGERWNHDSLQDWLDFPGLWGEKSIWPGHSGPEGPMFKNNQKCWDYPVAWGLN